MDDLKTSPIRALQEEMAQLLVPTHVESECAGLLVAILLMIAFLIGIQKASARWAPNPAKREVDTLDMVMERITALRRRHAQRRMRMRLHVLAAPVVVLAVAMGGGIALYHIAFEAPNGGKASTLGAVSSWVAWSVYTVVQGAARTPLAATCRDLVLCVVPSVFVAFLAIFLSWWLNRMVLFVRAYRRNRVDTHRRAAATAFIHTTVGSACFTSTEMQAFIGCDDRVSTKALLGPTGDVDIGKSVDKRRKKTKADGTIVPCVRPLDKSIFENDLE